MLCVVLSLRLLRFFWGVDTKLENYFLVLDVVDSYKVAKSTQNYWDLLFDGIDLLRSILAKISVVLGYHERVSLT